MKKILLCAVAIAASLSVVAQNEHIHVFRSDSEKVSTFKATTMQTLVFAINL